MEEEEEEEEDRPSSDLSLRAEELVTTVLERAHRAVTNDVDHRAKATETDREMKTIAWASCGDFTVELGRRQISEYIGTWEVHPRWLLHVAFLETTEEEVAMKEDDGAMLVLLLHRYRAQWSIPTRQAPIPTETASVYFVVRVSTSGPRAAPVEVRYAVESSPWWVHTAGGQTRFREKWLADVVESKALLKRTVDF